MKKSLYSLALTLCLSATAAIAQDAPSADGAKKLPEPSVARGKKAWTENCARCHEMRDPKDLTDREWPAVIRHMRIRGGLTGQEERDMFELFIKGNN